MNLCSLPLKVILEWFSSFSLESRAKNLPQRLHPFICIPTHAECSDCISSLHGDEKVAHRDSHFTAVIFEWKQKWRTATVCFTTCLSFRWQNTVLIWMTSTLLWRWIQNKIYSAFGQDGLNHCNKGHLAALNEHISAVTVITLWWRRLKTNIMQQRFLERIVQ